MEISFVNDEFSTDIDEVIAFTKKNSLKYIELRKINDKDTFRAKVITPVSAEQNEVSEKYSQTMDSEK